MTDEHDAIAQDLAGYVLGSLEAAERMRVEDHVRTCATCAGVIAEYGAVLGMLPTALEPVRAPEASWTAIRETARRREPRRRSASPTNFVRWLRVARWPAVAVVMASLLGWNVMLQRELTRRAPGPAPGPEVEALSRRPGRIVILKGTGQPRASARIFLAVDGGGHLAVSGLDRLPRGRMYHLWFVRTEASAVAAAGFVVDPTGRAWAKVTVPVSLDDVRAIVITEEAEPAGASPTGRPLLEAEGWR